MNRRIEKSIRATLQNGRRLLDDSEFLEFNDPPATAYFLSLIAQEEFAKAFLLALVHRGVVPWDQHILRASRDHKCKQLLCIVMDYLNPDLDEFIERCNAVVLRREPPKLPPKVADAINILRYEKISRWISRSWVWGEDPEYNRDSVAIAEGRHDKRKQDALYVRLGADGGVAATAKTFTRDMLEAEKERANCFASIIENLLGDKPKPALNYDKVEEAFRLLFTPTARAGNSDV